jgi:hypothetical protein
MIVYPCAWTQRPTAQAAGVVAVNTTSVSATAAAMRPVVPRDF